jgi:hypothetical protein
VKKLKETKTIKPKIERELLRTSRVNELRHVEGDTDHGNEITAVTGGQGCCT